MTQTASERLGRVVLAFVWFDLGLLVLLLPWTHLWENNSLLTHYPGLIPIMLSGYMRGIVSGIGVLDMLIAAEALLRRPAPVATRQ